MTPTNVLLALTAIACLPQFGFAGTEQKCTGQSCHVAAVSGSSGVPFDNEMVKILKTGGGDKGTRCVEQYRYKLGLSVPPGYVPLSKPPANFQPKPGWKMRRSKFGITYGKHPRGLLWDKQRIEHENLEKRQRGGGNVNCKPYALVFAGGTMDGGANIMRPQIQQGLERAQPGKWMTEIVRYNPDMDGNWCAGLPGGYACVNQVNTLHNNCPQTKFIIGGVSQGAMVAHNCAAFIDDKAKKMVAGVVAIGDPMNGAPIKGISTDKVKTLCNASDGVCKGEFNISFGHMAYSIDSALLKWIEQKVGAL